LVSEVGKHFVPDVGQLVAPFILIHVIALPAEDLTSEIKMLIN